MGRFFANLAQSMFLTAFHGGNIVPDSGSWALFTDESFITEVARQQVDESFKSSGKFRLQVGIDASWSAPDGRAIVTLDCFGKAVDACDLGVFGAYDIDLRVNVSIDISALPSASGAFTYGVGSLQQNIKVNTWKSDWDTAFCVFGSTLVWPYLGLRLMEENTLTWLEYEASGLIGPCVSLVILAEANKAGNVPPPTKKCTRPESSKDEFVCTNAFDAGSLAVGGLPELAGYAGRPDGLVLMGFMFWTQRLGRGFHVASIDTHSFHLNPVHFSCQGLGAGTLTAAQDHPEDFVRYTATIALNFVEV